MELMKKGGLGQEHEKAIAGDEIQLLFLGAENSRHIRDAAGNVAVQPKISDAGSCAIEDGPARFCPEAE